MHEVMPMPVPAPLHIKEGVRGRLASSAMEDWKRIEDAPKYIIARDGTVKFASTGRVTKSHVWANPAQGNYRYVRIVLRVDKKPRKLMVAKLVAKAFLPPPTANQKVIKFLDGDQLNVHADNLCWTTAHERMAAAGEKAAMTFAQRPGKAGGSSKYKGVRYQEGYGLWEARIRIKGERIQLGSFATEEEAARRYDDAAVKHFGSSAFTNLPRATPDVQGSE